MNNILVPTDFSANARNALSYAIELAKLFGSHLTIVHTFTTTRRGDMMKSMDDIIRRDVEKQIEDLRPLIPAEVRWDSAIIQGDAVAAIGEYATKIKADLIVMGTKGATGWEEVFIGSVTGGVMRHTEVPLLAIPDKYAFQPIKEVVLAMDSLDVTDPAHMVLPLKAIAEKNGASVTVYHHDQEQEDSSATMSDAYNWLGKDIPLSFTYEQGADNVNDKIAAFVDSSNADMLCMIRRDRRKFSFFDRFFQGSATLTQVFHCTVPLLILHAE